MNRQMFCIAADHPCLDGHFPDAPIVPGVIVLDRVIAAVQADNVTLVTGIRRCKFVAGLYPDENCQIEWRLDSSARARFTCSGPNGAIAHGILALAPRKEKTGHG